MRVAIVYLHNQPVAELIEHSNDRFTLQYYEKIKPQAISLALSPKKSSYEFNSFPAFFEGLLPEGPQLEALLRQSKIDRNDFFSQLLAVGEDLVGAVTVRVKRDD